MTTTDSPTTPVARDDRSVRLAWASLALLPLALIVPMFLGPALGVEEQTRAPFGTFVVLTLVIALLLAVPTLLSRWFAGRARTHGDLRGRAPALLAVVLSLAYLAVNVLSWVAWLVTDAG